MNELDPSVQTAADLVMQYFDQFQRGDLDLKTLSPAEFAQLCYSFEYGDSALSYAKNPDLYTFKSKILIFQSTR